jgi:hypothetical protein
MASRDVLIFGAGFSHAVAPMMPLLDRLGSEIAKQLGLASVPIGPSNGLSFEEWLTLLSSDQPHLSSVENAENVALFERLKDAAAQFLIDCEATVLLDAPPPWLLDLVKWMHYRKSTAITFNYDRLVEAALLSIDLVEWTTSNRVTESHILENLPRLPPEFNPAPELRSGTFRLLKLHGSLGWWISPHDEAGSTLLRSPATTGFGPQYPLNDGEQSRWFPGAELFVVPPTISKTGYYRNFVTRELWRKTYKALGAAERIAIVGYSLPPSDLTVNGMLEAVLRNSDVEVVVVNNHPDSVVAQVKKLGGTTVRSVGGNDCVKNYVESVIKESSEHFSKRLSSLTLGSQGGLPVVATDGVLDMKHMFNRVASIDVDSETRNVTLRTRPFGNVLQNAAAAMPDGNMATPYPSLNDVVIALASADSVEVEIDGNLKTPVGWESALHPYGSQPIAKVLYAV